MQKAVSSLFNLTMQGNLDALKELVNDVSVKKRKRSNGLLDSVGESGMTVLHLAAFCGHPLIIRWLLSSEEGGGRAAGFSMVLAKANKGMTALHIAASKLLLECCQALVEGSMIENGERAEMLNAADDSGHTVLHFAAISGHPSIIKWLLSSEEGGGRAAGFKNVLAKTNKGMTVMHYAAGRGHLECCQALVEGSMIDNGERAEMLNAADDSGHTVLHFAAISGHPSIIKWLLSLEGGRAAGFTSVLARGKKGMTVMHITAGNGHLECCQALAEGSKIENAELLNAVDENGFTALHYATLMNRPSIIKWLLSSEEGGGRAAGFTSSSITAKTSNSSSALHFAVGNGSVEALNALLAGCSVGERLTLFLHIDKRGWTPLHKAAVKCSPQIIRELLLNHPETQTIVDARDHRGMTALHRAVIGGIDEESRKEWQEDAENDFNIGDAAVITALLTAPAKEDEESTQAAMIDPNLGIKFE